MGERYEQSQDGYTIERGISVFLPKNMSIICGNSLCAIALYVINY